MSLASAQDIATVHLVVEPWLRITTYTHAYGGGLGAEGPYSFEAEVKVAPDAPLGAEWGTAEAARAIRAHLLSRAEEALDALAAAGWHLTASPGMELSGRLTRHGLDDDGRPIQPSLHDNFSMKLRFEVDRPRPLAERMMTPEAIAGAIMDTWARGERPWNG